jgi:hypothetical protein
MVDTTRQPDGDLCHCAESMHPHRHLSEHVLDGYGTRVLDHTRNPLNGLSATWRDLAPDEARDWLLKEIFG